MRLFNPDSKFMAALTKMADLMWINILTLALCIPVITIGAALTAKDYMCYKILKNEDTGTTKGYFRSFKQNFKQATVIWIIMLFVIMLGIIDVFFVLGLQGDGTQIVRAVMFAFLFFIYIGCIMIFPVLARFDNTVKGTIKSGIHMTVAILPRAILMGILYLIPVLVFMFIGIQSPLIPIVIMFGISGPGYLSAMLYRKAFEQVEARFYEEHPDQAPETDPVEEAMQAALKRDEK
ncbi:MAG: YesL family protein [Lachnospiraceae bacterium]|nr:YesL family protein [Lachnospiraceae bacterium]